MQVQPTLECCDVRVFRNYALYIDSMSRILKPLEKEREIVAGLPLEIVPPELLVLDLVWANAAEKVGYMGHRMFITSYLHRSAEPVSAALEGECNQRADIIHGYHL